MNQHEAIPLATDSIALLANQLLRLAIEAWTSRLAHDPIREQSYRGTIAHAIRTNIPLLGPDAAPPPDLADDDDAAHLRWLLLNAELRSNSESSSNTLRPSPSPEPTPPSLISQNPSQASDWACLVASVHRALSLLTTHTSFTAAVESSASRQAYNLAYGLTHEINNPLGNIVARAQRLIGSVHSEADRKSLATIVDQAMRAHEMLAEVMRAVQPQPMHLAPSDVMDVVHSAFSMLEPEATRLHVRWDLDPPSHPLYANVHPEALTEALRLVARNALEVSRPYDAILWAVSASDHPASLTTDSSALQLAGHASKHAPVDSHCVRITIRDSGPGLSPRAAQSAFDLFYSGREHGRGLGISLAVVRRIVDGHGGHVRMRSEPNAGCTVEIDLPQIEPPPRPRSQLRLKW